MIKLIQKFNRRIRDDKNFRIKVLKEIIITAILIMATIIGLTLVQCDICNGMCHCR